MQKFSGEEHGVAWETCMLGANVKIKVTQISTGKTEEKTYRCAYSPIFGYDKDDIAYIEKLTDALIVKYATDGYKGMWGMENGKV